MKRLCYYHSKDPDGWVIAKERGGGGYRNAAGFETTELSSVFK